MPNINDYLTWFGDIPFSCAAFNDVDNLILAQFCYPCWCENDDVYANKLVI